MRKILISLLAVSGASSSFAANNLFQQFDNQYNIGYGISQTTLQNGGKDAQSTNQSINLEVERLFDMGVWMDVTANMVTAATTNQPAGTIGSGIPTNTTTQNPNFGGINAKVGYAFPLAGQHLQVTPYALVGRNTNLAQSTIFANEGQSIANDVYYSGGIGARVEYRINNAIQLFADQDAVYNWDQSGPTGGIAPQNNIGYTTTLGAKFNVVKNLQLGVNGFYNYYQSAAPAAVFSVPGLPDGGTVYTPHSGIGGLVSVGLTY